MENEVKNLAVEEILKIYKEDKFKRIEVLQALGQVGGKNAIEAILSIYKEDVFKRAEVIHALGEAGKNS